MTNAKPAPAPRPKPKGPPDALKHLSGIFVGDEKLRLQLQGILGNGGYGVVYRAVDVTSSLKAPRYYAVKCLIKAEPSDHRRYHFQRNEIALHEVASASNYPGVLKLHRVFVDDMRHVVFVVLDYCQDGDLFTQITEQQRYIGNDILIKHVFIQLLDLVEYLHDMGIYHRDLKPDNVLCKDNGTSVCLSDFGLATVDTVSEELGCGSPSYMSPETLGVFRPLIKYSPKFCDIWALGIILINLVCARNPWEQADPDPKKHPIFYRYTLNPDHLGLILPISSATNEILKRIFKLNPLDRISIPALRIEICKVRTFSRPEKEHWLAHKARQNKRIGGIPAAIPFRNDRMDISSSGETVVPQSNAPAQVVKLQSSPFDTDSGESLDLGSFTLSRSASSIAETEGPVTPEMGALIEVDIVDEPLDLDMPGMRSMPKLVTRRRDSNLRAVGKWWGGAAPLTPPRKKKPSSPEVQGGTTLVSADMQAKAMKGSTRGQSPISQTISHLLHSVNDGEGAKGMLGRAIKRFKLKSAEQAAHEQLVA